MKLLPLGGVFALAITTVVHADEAPANATVSQVTVTAPSSISDLQDIPTTTVSITADEIVRTINVLTPEDVLRYLPDILIRQRHIGDTQSPVTTRTSGVGASARSLIYVDGVLISSLIGNNNTSASPKWGLIPPDAIERVDVLYGPFAAQYAGNSIGSVIAFTTRMPKSLEASAEVQAADQAFSKYGDSKSYGTGRFAANLGDRFDQFAFRLTYNHLDSHAQPLTYATSAAPAVASAAGIPVTGSFSDASRTGAPIQVLGSMGIEHQAQDNLSSRVTYDLTPTLTAAYTLGLFHNDDDATVNSYLRNASGQTVYAGAFNIAGRSYVVAPSAFSNGVYDLEELELAQGLSLASHSGGVLDFELIATSFDYLKSRQRIPTGALPTAFSGGPGTTTSLDGTGWRTLDANGTWRPPGSPNVVTFGVHEDGFRLNNPKYALSDWIDGSAGQTLTFSRGRTETQALWLQDTWAVTPQVTATFGGRYEHWRAYDGLNVSVSPALNATQPALKKDAFSPKATVSFAPSNDWIFKASAGIAYRFPTVTELYQAITTGTLLSVPNPNLRPEQAFSSELSAERLWTGGSLRASLFDERIHNALLSQTAPLLAGSTSLFSFVQNVDRTHATGVEVVADQKDAVVHGLELSGWATYVDAKTDRDPTFLAAQGKDEPQLPRLRAAAVASYAWTPQLDLSLAARYSDRSFATIDNSDPYANTYQGFGGYFVADAHARYRINPHLTADVGVDNLGGRSYFLFHPFPQRTFVADLKYSF
jgi:iron complex outermembrane recepter protein